MRKKILIGLFLAVFGLTACGKSDIKSVDTQETVSDWGNSELDPGFTLPDTESADVSETSEFDYSSVPPFSDAAYVEINGNVPYFTATELQRGTSSFEEYSDLDNLGRCGVAFASIGTDIMPTEERGEIGSVKPTGWHTVKYAGVVDGNYLYNRCHLIAYCLSGENANEKNLITGTRYLNVTGMLPFETQIAKYVESSGNHVLYRVTPVFVNDELIARGVLMEAQSIEDNGAGVKFNIFCYNVQPGITINYETGDSSLSGESVSDDNSSESTGQNKAVSYVINKNSRKFHSSSCPNASKIAEGNRLESSDSRDTLISEGYEPAKCCNP